LSKIENEKPGFESPSDAVIIKLAEVLAETDSDVVLADELLALSERPLVGLGEKLAKNPGASAFFRFAIDRLCKEEWQELLSRLKKKRELVGRRPFRRLSRRSLKSKSEAPRRTMLPSGIPPVRRNCSDI
jgi:hypothetical protein